MRTLLIEGLIAWPNNSSATIMPNSQALAIQPYSQPRCLQVRVRFSKTSIARSNRRLLGSLITLRCLLYSFEKACSQKFLFKTCASLVRSSIQKQARRLVYAFRRDLRSAQRSEGCSDFGSFVCDYIRTEYLVTPT